MVEWEGKVKSKHKAGNLDIKRETMEIKRRWRKFRSIFRFHDVHISKFLFSANLCFFFAMIMLFMKIQYSSYAPYA